PNSESKPVTTNRKGSDTEGAVRPKAAGELFIGDDSKSATTDAGQVASVRLHLGFGDEPALFELRVKQRRTPAGAGTNHSAFGQRGNGFQNFHQRLRRFEAARVQFNDLFRHADKLRPVRPVLL